MKSTFLRAWRQERQKEPAGVCLTPLFLLIPGIEDARMAYMNSKASLGPPRPASTPVALTPASRSDGAVLENLGQLFCHDLSEAYGLLPNADGTFNNRRLDQFRAGADPERQAWLIKAAGALGGFAMTRQTDDGGMTISDFFVVRALRRAGVGRQAARLIIATFPGRWRIAFQSYNPGAQDFWSQVATDAAGDNWSTYDDAPVDGRPPDTWITFTT